MTVCLGCWDEPWGGEGKGGREGVSRVGGREDVQISRREGFGYTWSVSGSHVADEPVMHNWTKLTLP